MRRASFLTMLLFGIATIFAMTESAQAGLFGRRQQNIQINNGVGLGGAQQIVAAPQRARLGLFQRRSQNIQINNGFPAAIVQPAYVNQQLILPSANRLTLNRLNTFRSPYHGAANIRFVSNGVQYLNSAPIVAAPIYQRYVQQPIVQPIVQQIVQPQYVPQQVQVQAVQQTECVEQPATTNVNYITQPVQTVQAVQVQQPSYVVAPQRQRLFVATCH